MFLWIVGDREGSGPGPPVKLAAVGEPRCTGHGDGDEGSRMRADHPTPGGALCALQSPRRTTVPPNS